MSNYITSNTNNLKVRHYLLKANANNYFFNISPGRIKEYQSKYGDNFSIIIYRSELETDAYIIPYIIIKELLADEYLQPATGGGSRWIGDIRDGYFYIRSADDPIYVKSYYNNVNNL
jgi:hypothetical protein